MPPKVSIVLPTYNGERYLAGAVRSCLGQTYANIEVIVVVDGSTDNSVFLLEEFQRIDPRLRIHISQNQGLPTALNVGFGLASGELWTWTSDDNIFLPHAIETMVNLASRGRDLHHVCADFWIINEKDVLKGRNRTGWACFLYPAEMARQAGEYRACFPLVEDVDFFLRLTNRFGPFIRHPQALYVYREHRGSLSTRFIGRRAELSLRLHLSHWREGIITSENYNLRRLFETRVQAAALCGDAETTRNILEVAEENRVFFLPELKASAQRAFSPAGRLKLRAKAKVRGLQQRLNFYLNRTLEGSEIKMALDCLEKCQQ